MNLSRAAKKFRDSDEPRKKAAKKSAAPEPAKAAEAIKAPGPVKEPQPVPAPVVEVAQSAPQAEDAPDEPKKKRPRFVFVRQKGEKQEPSKLPPLPQPSKKVSAKLMSKNLAMPPKEEPTKVIRG